MHDQARLISQTLNIFPSVGGGWFGADACGRMSSLSEAEGEIFKNCTWLKKRTEGKQMRHEDRYSGRKRNDSD